MPGLPASRSYASLIGLLLLSISLSTSLGCESSEPEPASLNLVLISVDTLRADHLGAYGSTRRLTPHIDALASQSVTFEHAFSPAPFTLASVGSMLTGRYPEEIGVEWNRSVLAPKIPTLAQILKAAGWHTGAVVSNFVLRHEKSGIDVGFDLYDDTFTQIEVTRRVPERVAGHTTRAAIEALDAFEEEGAPNEKGAPFFLWVHYQDPHGPYTPGEAVRERYFDESRAAGDPGELRVSPGAREFGALPVYQYVEERQDPEFYRAGYEGEIHLLDVAIGGLLESLRSRGALKNTIVVFTADHGESLGEDDFWFAHGELLSDPLVRIPLLFRLPNGETGRRRDPASLVDLVPTIAALLDVEKPGRTSGRDLFARDAESANPTLYLTNLREAGRPRFGIVSDGYKYVVTPRMPGAASEPGPHSERLSSLDDRAEALEKKRPKLARKLRRRLIALHQSLEEPETPANSQELTPDERSRLEALGYIDPEAR